MHPYDSQLSFPNIQPDLFKKWKSILPNASLILFPNCCHLLFLSELFDYMSIWAFLHTTSLCILCKFYIPFLFSIATFVCTVIIQLHNALAEQLLCPNAVLNQHFWGWRLEVVKKEVVFKRGWHLFKICLGVFFTKETQIELNLFFVKSENREWKKKHFINTWTIISFILL